MNKYRDHFDHLGQPRYLDDPWTASDKAILLLFVVAIIVSAVTA